MVSPLRIARPAALLVATTALADLGVALCSGTCAATREVCAEEAALLQIQLEVHQHRWGSEHHNATSVDAGALAEVNASKPKPAPVRAANASEALREAERKNHGGADHGAARVQAVVLPQLAQEPNATDTPVNNIDKPAVQSWGGWVMFFLGVVFSSLVYYILTRIWYYVKRAIGKAIEVGVEIFDRRLIGVDMEIGRLDIDLYHGCITINGVTVHNPEGYNSEYLLRAKKVIVDLNMQTLITSFFHNVIVENLELQRVDVIYEKSWKSSNCHDVLSFIHGKDVKEEKTSVLRSMVQKARGDAAGEAAGSEPEEASSSAARTPKHPHKARLEKVIIEDVGVRVQAQMLGGHGVRVSVADINYKNFAEEVGEVHVQFILEALLKMILKTALAHVVGERSANKCL